MKENWSSGSLRQSQQREKGEPGEELRHLDKTQKFFPSFIDSFTHAHVSGALGGLLLCGVPLRPRPPHIQGRVNRGEGGTPSVWDVRAASRHVGGGPPWSSPRGQADKGSSMLA